MITTRTATSKMAVRWPYFLPWIGVSLTVYFSDSQASIPDGDLPGPIRPLPEQAAKPRTTFNPPTTPQLANAPAILGAPKISHIIVIKDVAFIT